jgi:YVTN family beta-propeller protein
LKRLDSLLRVAGTFSLREQEREVMQSAILRLTLSAIAIALVLALAAGTRSTANVANDSARTLDGRPLTPAGSLVADASTGQAAVGALPVGFVRSPDNTGPDGGGRYLIAVNSGFGVQFVQGSKPNQSLAVIDLNARPAPQVIQNIYFPSPQSANVGAVFDTHKGQDGSSFTLYVSGGFENKIWMFHLHPGAPVPIRPTSFGPTSKVEAPSIDVTGFTSQAASENYNDNVAPVYPTGLAISADGESLYVANNLADNLGVVSELGYGLKLARTDLHRENKDENIYPYDVAAVTPEGGSGTSKLFVSCWNSSTVAVVDARNSSNPVKHISVGGHPTAVLLNKSQSRLYVVNTGSDNVSVIDTRADREVERISVKLAEGGLAGNAPEAIALSSDERTLFVANSHSNSVAVVELCALSRSGSGSGGERGSEEAGQRSKVRGFIPTGLYPSALAVAGRTLYIGNGKGTGFKNSSLEVDNLGLSPNMPNDRFPRSNGSHGGQYIVSLLSGNISAVDLPDDAQLARYTQQVMRNNGLIGESRASLFKNGSPIKHVIYIIRENRSYDQVFGDLTRAGNGEPADGDPSVAIFGSGDAASRPDGTAQQVTANAKALALRFGVLDRFFVNSEASPDGHNWATAAFSSDYVDKSFRWNYSGRGRTYDFEGFNRLPDNEPPAILPPGFRLPTTADALSDYMRRYVPYLNGSRDVAEPETLYLWDAAARAGLTYRNYGEYTATVSAEDVKSINSRHPKPYPDLSPTVSAFATKKSLEGHFSTVTRNFDLWTPDAITTDSYRAAKKSSDADPVISATNADERLRGLSRLAVWLDDFRGYVNTLQSTGQDQMPNFSIVRFSNDHTSGMRPGLPTPQFAVADNDYAVGRLVEAISNSPYWKDTAIFVIEDDAQDGPDHVDAHRSPALVISAYNRPGALVHEYHTTVSLIRTMELLLGMQPMNQLDANANPIDIFQDTPDLRPFKASLPEIAFDNLIVPPRDPLTAELIDKTMKMDLVHADMADPIVLNQVIWDSVKGAGSRMPVAARLPAVDAMRIGIVEDNDKREVIAAGLKPKN